MLSEFLIRVECYIIEGEVVFEKSIAPSSLDKDYAFDLGAETVTIDYSYQSKKNDNIKFIKTLSFDYSSNRTKLATQIAKEWAWNYLKIDDINKNSGIEKKNLTTVIYAKNVDDNINAAIKILNENSKIISVDNEDRIEEFAKSIVDDIK